MHKLDRNMPCWCGSGKKYKHCHYDFDEKLDDMHRRGAIIPTHDMIKNEAQIAGIRESAKINVAVLDYVAAHIRAGISTAEIDRWVYEQTTAMGGIPAPLNYEGFPKSVCTSIDDQVCHGIPSEDDILCNGDIINVDCSTIYKGYYSDSSRMFIIGETTPEKKKQVWSRSSRGAFWATWGRPCMIWPKRTVTASCATSAATAWAFSSTKSRGSAM